MTFAECIALAVESGKLKPEKGQEATEAWQKAFDEGLAKGLSKQTANDQAAVAAVEKLGKKTADAKWMKIKEMEVSARIYQEVSTSDTPHTVVGRTMDAVEVAQERLVRSVHKQIATTLEAAGNRLLGAKVRDLRNVIYEMYGDSKGDEVAKVMAKELLNADDFLRRRANLEGTNVHANPERRIGLDQSRQKLRELARKAGSVDAVRNTWINEHMEGLDWNVVEWKGDLVPLEDRADFLLRQWEGVYTHGMKNTDPNALHEASLAARLNRPDPFYYKDAETFLAMQEKYGQGNLFEQLVSGIETKTRDIALLEKLGPHPVMMKEYLKKLAIKRAGELDAEQVPKRMTASMGHKVKVQNDILEERYKVFAHLVGNGEESLMAQGMGTVKNLTTSGILGAAFISNLTDVSFMRQTARLYQMPRNGILTGAVKTFMQMPSKAMRKEALDSGAGMEMYTSLALASQRWMGPMDGSYWGKWVSDKLFRASFQTPWTQAGRIYATHFINKQWADFAKTEFEKLPFTKRMGEFGITKEDWDIFRKTPPVTLLDGRSSVIRPLDVLNRKDLDPVARQRLSDKFFDFGVDFGNQFSPTTSTREHVALGAALDKSRAQGQVMAMVSTVKGFPTLMFTRYLTDRWHLEPTTAGRLRNIGHFAIGLTLGGAFITQMKQLAALNDPLPMNDWKFWLRSFLNGGSFGYLGDIVFGTLGDYQHGGFADVLAGPEAAFLDKIKAFTFDDQFDFLATWHDKGLDAALKKYKGMKDVANFAARYFPMPWQGRILIQRAILDQIVNATDPNAAARARRQQTEMGKQGRGSWWDDQGHIRLPNLGTVVNTGGGG